MQMYAVVADIRAYPDFLNWCQNVEILEEKDDSVVAKLNISYSKLKMAFTTRNTNKPGESIRLSLVDGPFSALSGQWDFQCLSPQASKVSVEMDFDFDLSLVPGVFEKVFGKLISAELDAFLKRAQQLYGTP